MDSASGTPASSLTAPQAHAAAPWREYLRLARPAQWAKGAFVLVGAVYGHALTGWQPALAVIGALLAFGFASSACYVVNDIADREADRLHPHKRRRPLASGTISPSAAAAFAAVLLVLAALAVGIVGYAKGSSGATASGVWQPGAAMLTGLCVLLYAANTMAYSAWIKHRVILDVVSLSLGFVLRVLGGCAAVMVEPSTWLLNCTFFLAMYLAFGKRLGERRTMGGDSAAALARHVQTKYTDDVLRMVVVVTAVATLITYAGYVQARAEQYTRGFNLLWVTMLPATYAVLRSMLLLEKGSYDDPTELAAGDRAFQAAALIFAGLTVGLMWWFAGPR